MNSKKSCICKVAICPGFFPENLRDYTNSMQFLRDNREHLIENFKRKNSSHLVKRDKALESYVKEIDAILAKCKCPEDA